MNSFFSAPKLERFEAERIEGMKVEAGQKLFYVKWKNFEPRDNTWEPEKNLEGVADLLRDFERRHPPPAAPCPDPKDRDPHKATPCPEPKNRGFHKAAPCAPEDQSSFRFLRSTESEEENLSEIPNTPIHVAKSPFPTLKAAKMQKSQPNRKNANIEESQKQKSGLDKRKNGKNFTAAKINQPKQFKDPSKIPNNGELIIETEFIEEIIDHIVLNGVIFVKLKWKSGYKGELSSFYFPIEVLKNLIPQLVFRFLKNHIAE